MRSEETQEGKDLKQNELSSYSSQSTSCTAIKICSSLKNDYGRTTQPFGCVLGKPCLLCSPMPTICGLALLYSSLGSCGHILGLFPVTQASIDMPYSPDVVFLMLT